MAEYKGFEAWHTIALHEKSITAGIVSGLATCGVPKSFDGFDDIRQEVVIHCCQRFNGCRSPDRPGSWIYVTARNRTIDYVKRVHRNWRSNVDLESEGVSELRGAEDPNLRLVAIAEQLVDLLRHLSERDQELIVRRFLLDQSPTEIKDEMGLSTAAYESALRRAKQRLAAVAATVADPAA